MGNSFSLVDDDDVFIDSEVVKVNENIKKRRKTVSWKLPPQVGYIHYAYLYVFSNQLYNYCDGIKILYSQIPLFFNHTILKIFNTV